MRAFAVVLFGEIFGRFGADLFIIVIPRARPLGAPLPIMVARIDSDAVARPCAETRLDPVERPLRAIGGHCLAQDGRARLALLGGALVAPLDVLIGPVGQAASHALPISFNDKI